MRTGTEELDRDIEAVLETARQRFGVKTVERIGASKLSVFEPSNWEHPRQRTTWVYTPGLTARAWWSREQCGRLIPMIEAFEASTNAIRSELEALRYKQGSTYEHLSLHPDSIKGWRSQFFIKDYLTNEELLSQVPTLAGLLERFDSKFVERFELFLSVLDAGGEIPAHFGGGNQRLTLHLPLWVPEGDIQLRVDGESRPWKMGQVTIFDDTFDHEAWNRSGEARGVLLFKAYHPELSVEEVEIFDLFRPLFVKVYRAFLKERGAGAARVEL